VLLLHREARGSVTLSLRLDSSGGLWLTQGEGEDARATLLGPVADPVTSYRVPVELLGEWERLEREWRDAVEFRDACKAEAIETYRRNTL
jgi:hypothetical protein